MDALRAEGVCRAYGRQKVLDKFCLALAPGEFAALMGPSGSGKSTFLGIAAGLLAADAGNVEIGGRSITSMGDGDAARFRRRHVGVVYQSCNLLESATVAENIAMPVRLDHGRVDRSRLASVVSALGLSGCERKRPRELSGGECQRVAIARALFAEPDVVLADEPTGNLDMAAAKNICGLLRSVNSSGRSAILLVTHDPVVAASADTVHFLKEGRIVASFPTNRDPSGISRRYLETYC